MPKGNLTGRPRRNLRPPIVPPVTPPQPGIFDDVPEYLQWLGGRAKSVVGGAKQAIVSGVRQAGQEFGDWATGLPGGQLAEDWVWGGQGGIQEPAQNPQPPQYTIAETGDTFESLGQKFDFDPTTLAQMNPDISSPKAGTAINIPANPLSAVTGSQEYQQVSPPDTPLSAVTGYVSPEDRAHHPSTAFYDPTIPGPESPMYSSPVSYPTDPKPAELPYQPPQPQEPTGPSKLKIPESPSAFEAVNWLTGAGLTGTAMNMAGRQLRLDRPEYWDATGARADILKGMEQFIVAEFGLPDGEIDWDAAIAQDPYIIDTLDKLGYLDTFGYSGDVGGGEYQGKYSFPVPSYSQGYGARPSDYRQPSNMGLVSWSI